MHPYSSRAFQQYQPWEISFLPIYVRLKASPPILIKHLGPHELDKVEQWDSKNSLGKVYYPKPTPNSWGTWGPWNRVETEEISIFYYFQLADDNDWSKWWDLNSLSPNIVDFSQSYDWSSGSSFNF